MPRQISLSLTTSILMGLLICFFCPAGTAEDQTLTITVEKGECWWAGIISESYMMPLRGKAYSFDFYADTAGNQAQPLLISNQGRYIWSDDPFRFDFKDGTISLMSRYNSIQTGRLGTTLKDVYRYVSDRFFPPSGKIPDPILFTKPQWNTWIEFTYNQNQKEILEYAHKIVENGFPAGVLMIDEGWAKTYGDWDFDRATFPDPKGMMDELHGLGFHVMLWVCPYITSNGHFYQDLYLDHVDKKKTVWIVNEEKPSFPAIVQWWNGFSAVADLSNPEGKKWFKGQLDNLIETYQVDGFKFDGGDAFHYSPPQMMSPAKSFLRDITPNRHCELFAQLGLDYPLNEYRACWKMGGQPIGQRLRDKNHNWEDLRKLIPGSLTQGIMGYAFTCPDLIGGGEFLSFIDLAEVDQELIVRAAQCHALMPMMQFSVAPWRVLDREHFDACKAMANLHAKMGEEILALARQSAKTGEPIVRHLDYEYPHQGFDDCSDQFLLGDSILVAPVLEKGARKRTVRFPPGKWKGNDGSVVDGPCAMEVDALLEHLPWYRLVRG